MGRRRPRGNTYVLPKKQDCPKCESKNTDIDFVEEDRWRYGGYSEGHYTAVVGCICWCLDCKHEWDYEEDDYDYEEPDYLDDIDYPDYPY